jgi:glycine cleavage system pyridoxal-binding protein P
MKKATQASFRNPKKISEQELLQRLAKISNMQRMLNAFKGHGQQFAKGPKERLPSSPEER